MNPKVKEFYKTMEKTIEIFLEHKSIEVTEDEFEAWLQKSGKLSYDLVLREDGFKKSVPAEISLEEYWALPEYHILPDIQAYVDQMEKPPTWCEMVQQERHQLLGELIDAMIYSGDAVIEVQSLLAEFKNRGLVRNQILPE